MRTKDLFCANCQEMTTHTATIDGNGEYLFTCTNVLQEATEATEAVLCGRMLKLPADIATKKQADKLFEAHTVENEGQLSVAYQEKMLDVILSDSEEVETEASPEE